MSPSTPQIENRTEPRYLVSWRAHVQLPNGQMVEVRVKDISESGMGMISDYAVPSSRVLDITVGVPDLTDPSRLLAVPGRASIAFSVMQGHDFRVGVRWAELSPAAQELWRTWVRRLRNHG